MNHPPLASAIATTDHCSNLRHKGMYVMSLPDPDERRFYDRYDATAYWCCCTQSGFGPDRQPVRPDLCAHASGRACCER
jgi:hypothetical protein